MSKRAWIRGHESLLKGGASYFTCKKCQKRFNSKLEFKKHVHKKLPNA
jgi:tRNA(Ile2) C34 agmatinyltransferase TiaS